MQLIIALAVSFAIIYAANANGDGVRLLEDAGAWVLKREIECDRGRRVAHSFPLRFGCDKNAALEGAAHS
jgi:hypothetical protein